MSERVTFLSFGGGHDSTTILLKLIHDHSFRQHYAPDRLIVIFSDTGNERPATYAHIAKMQQLCAAHGIPFEYLSFDRGFHRGVWSQGLINFFTTKNTIGSIGFPKTCSINLKIEPIRRFIKQFAWHAVAGTPMPYTNTLSRFKSLTGALILRAFALRYGPITILIGIAAGEERRLAKADRLIWVRRYLKNRYPLIDIGFDRAKCREYIASIIPTTDYVVYPSNCEVCPFSSPLDVLRLKRRRPQMYELWRTLERRKLDANADLNAVEKTSTKKDGTTVTKVVNLNLAVFGQKTIDDVLAEAERLYADYADEEIEELHLARGHSVETCF